MIMQDLTLLLTRLLQKENSDLLYSSTERTAWFMASEVFSVSISRRFYVQGRCKCTCQTLNNTAETDPFKW